MSLIKVLLNYQTNIKQLIEENTILYNNLLKLNTDITYRKDILSKWQEASIELQDGAKAAYEDSLQKYENISDAFNKISNLKEYLIYIQETINYPSKTDSESLKLKILNISNLITNYNELKTTFFKDFQNLLHA
jgi:hypothetical protein